MLIHILQGLAVVILLASPFAIDRLGLKDMAQDYYITTMRATVDHGIVDHYANYGYLPETLDEDSLTKMGLTLEDVEGMTYEKLNDREFSLSSANTDATNSFSANSFVQLPVHKGGNSITEERDPVQVSLSVAPTQHQQVTVVTTLPNGKAGDTLHSGDALTLPKGTLFSVNVTPEEGYLAGRADPSNGKLQTATQIQVSDAQLKTYTLTVLVPEASVPHQKILVQVDDTKSGQRLTLSNGDMAKVGYGSRFTVSSQATEPGWLPGNLNHTSGVVKADTLITISEAARKICDVSTLNPEHQQLKISVVNAATDEVSYLSNGSSAKIPYGSLIRGEVVPDKGYTAGHITGIPADGILRGNTVITAQPATRSDIVEPEILNDLHYYVVDVKYSRHFIPPQTGSVTGPNKEHDWKDYWDTVFDGPTINYDTLYNGDKFKSENWVRKGKIITGPNTRYIFVRFSSASWGGLRADYYFKFNGRAIPTKKETNCWDGLTVFNSDYRCLIKVEPNTIYPIEYRDLDSLVGDNAEWYQVFQVIMRDAPTQDVRELSSTEATYIKGVRIPDSKVSRSIEYFHPNGKMMFFDVTK